MARPTQDHAAVRAAAAGMVRTLRDAGHVAYFAGGCVRDELLGLTPSDYDIATDATPDRVQSLFPRSSEVGKAFGVVIVHADRHGRDIVEVATFRADAAYSDARRPDSVRFSTPHDDAHRRDFTVNALFLDPFADPSSNPPGLPRAPETGAVIDLVGGVADLRARVLRAVGDPDQRLAEDHLRALRAARLAAKLAFAVEPATADAIRRHAAELRGVSRERIGDEVHRMLAHRSRALAAAHLASLGLLPPVLGIDAPSGGSPSGGSLSGGYRHLAAAPSDCDYAEALAAWALDLHAAHEPHDVHALVQNWRRALCLSNQDRDTLRAILDGVHRLVAFWSGFGIASRKRTAAAAWFGPALRLLSIDAPDLARRIAADRDRLASTPSGLAPTPLLTGDMLVEMGFRPGPAFKSILDGVYDAQLEEKIRTEAEARELARRLRV
jgi:poly(A) polymerase